MDKDSTQMIDSTEDEDCKTLDFDLGDGLLRLVRHPYVTRTLAQLEPVSVNLKVSEKNWKTVVVCRKFKDFGDKREGKAWEEQVEEKAEICSYADENSSYVKVQVHVSNWVYKVAYPCHFVINTEINKIIFTNVDDDEEVFTDKEWERFQRRVDEGYDLPQTGRYKLWLQMYYPDHLNGMCMWYS